MIKIFHYALRIARLQGHKVARLQVTLNLAIWQSFHYALRIAFLICAAIFILSGSICAAENLKFIDAMDDTGYYYDADSVKSESDEIFSVQMAVIKANLNRMYSYEVRITPASRTYEILSSRILSYDTRAVLETNNSRRPPQRYSDKSEMGQMVRLILYGD